MNLNRVQPLMHSIANLLPPKDVSWKGSEMSTKIPSRAPIHQALGEFRYCISSHSELGSVY